MRASRCRLHQEEHAFGRFAGDAQRTARGDHGPGRNGASWAHNRAGWFEAARAAGHGLSVRALAHFFTPDPDRMSISPYLVRRLRDSLTDAFGLGAIRVRQERVRPS